MKKIKSTWAPEITQDLDHYELDIVNELTNVLSNEIARQMDRDILRALGIEPDRHKRRMNSIKNIFGSE